MPKVCIDPGHGGTDPGALGVNGDFESRLVLNVGLMVKTIIAPMCDVLMTREDDTFVSLSERCRMANKWGADIYVSIHFNSATPDAHGWEVFTSGSTGSRKLANDLAAAHSEAFPEQKTRGIKQAGFYVIKETDMPAALWEGGFISNVKEAEWINQHETQVRMADAIAQGIINNLGLGEQAALTLEQRVARIEKFLNI
jgi:N-acetylmuramoyl-L-alanine amidase